MNCFDQYNLLKKEAYTNYWAKRILAQLGFAIKLSKVRNGLCKELIEAALDEVYAEYKEKGAIEKRVAQKVEMDLMPLSAEAKKHKVICAAHAHIDMNWMWGYQETVALTIDTFRTMLTLMKEYPDFTFSQSQASTYQIIEKYYPKMLEEIKQRIHEGRWEITASTWVETDKNMPSGESLSRHILYTKQYISKLFDVPEESMELDFEPDTFGHNINVPEILTEGKIKYYYHCRGYDGHNIYRWKSPSGSSVLVYREPTWYLGPIEYDMLSYVPEFCDEYKTNLSLKVYGVGDHGGGPTRRDVEMIRDMMNWPIQPTIEFGTFHQFFHELEKDADQFPVVDRELNCVFTGCYTTQTRIKMANRFSEDKLYDAETLSTMAYLDFGNENHVDSYGKAWKKTLFNQFHDIIPGSGVMDTREFAMGEFQKILSYANGNVNSAMSAIASSIDTSAIEVEYDPMSRSEGAGVGYYVTDHEPGKPGMSKYSFAQTERGNGKTRIFTLFNALQYDREEVSELTLWDWKGDLERIIITDSSGEEVPFKQVSRTEQYWQHSFVKLVILAKVPAVGYATYILKEKASTDLVKTMDQSPRVDHITDEDLVLENTKVKAVFSTINMKLISLTDKTSGKELVNKETPSCFFRYVVEDDVNGMTSWRVGRYTKIVDVNETCPVAIVDSKLTGIRQWIKYQMRIENSNIDATVVLNENSKTLEFVTSIDWHEVGRNKAAAGACVEYDGILDMHRVGDVTTGIPQIQFVAPFAFESNTYRYDIPFGTIDREALRMDVPANSFICALPNQGETSLMMVTDNKYGYRGADNTLTVNLIRSSFDPDRYPEYGVHNTRIGVAVCDNTENAGLIQCASEFCHPIYAISNTRHSGVAPMDYSFMKICGNAKVSAFKTTEAGDRAAIIRLYSTETAEETVKLTFAKPVCGAEYVDLTEKVVSDKTVIDEKSVIITVPAHAIRTIKVRF